MHESPAVRLGCTDCHGGDATVMGNSDLAHDHADYVAARERAHVLPKYPDSWHYPSSANPKQSYALLNREAPEFVRFVNPSDYRVAREACGACHIDTIEAGERSLMATGAMFFGGAAYNNGIVPFKNYIIGEAYTREGEPAKIVSPGDPPGTISAAQGPRRAGRALSAADLAGDSARRRVPRFRARRAQPRDPVRRSRPAQSDWLDPAA